MGESINKLKKVFTTFSSLIIFSGIFEIIIVIFLGVASNRILNFNLSDGAFLCIIAFGILYTGIKAFQLYYQFIVGAAPINEVKLNYDLELSKRGFIRKTLINNAIVETLYSLNNQTCTVPSINKNNIEGSFVCQHEITSSLSKLFSSLTNNIEIFGDCLIKSKFSFGFYLHHLFSIDENKEIDIINKISFLIDDNGFYENLPESIESNEIGTKLTIQNFLKESFNNSNSYTNHLNFKNKEFSFFASPTICICSKERIRGLLFMISDCPEFQIDAKEVFSIFNVIFSMWIDEYEKCSKNILKIN
jgi:hypothetical protein